MNLKEVYETCGIPEIPTWAENVQVVHPYTQEPIGLRDYQFTGVFQGLASDNQRFGIYDTMGAGKSLVAYIYSAWHASQGNWVISVMPPKLLAQYKSNFYRMLKGIPVWMEVFHGAPDYRKTLLSNWKTDKPHIVVTSPEMFKRHHEYFDSLGYVVLMQDEAKWMANPDNAMSRAVEAFLGPPGRKAALVMNGTPARTDLLNLYGYIEHTSPGVYASIDHFKRRHINYVSFNKQVRSKAGRVVNRRIYKIDGYKHMDELYSNLFLHGRRVEVPPPTSTEILYKEVSLSDSHYARYKQLVEEKLLIFDDNSIIDLTTSNSIRHICTRAVGHAPLLKLDEESTVMETVQEMVDELDLDKTKVVLCAYYQDTVEYLVKKFKNLKAVALYGKVAGAAAAKAKAQFLEDPDCKVMVLNYESGGVGLDGLQNVCHEMIAVEPTSVPGDFDQTVARLARSGQSNAVRIWNLVAEGTIYRKIIAERAERKTAISAVVRQSKDVTKAELRDELLGKV